MKLLFEIHLFISLIFLCSSLKAQEERGSVGINSDTVNNTGKKRALIIGISDYEQEDLKLTYADDDALLFNDYLTNSEKASKDDIVVLTNTDATSINIYSELENLLDRTEEGDEVFIYFAGHGDVVQKFNKKTGFLLAYDANSKRNYHGTGGVVALEDLNWISSQISQIKNARINLILDACHSGFIYEDGSKSNLQTLNNTENFKNSVKFLSCEPNQVSVESKELGHGYFTYYLVLGLMGAADELIQDNKLQYFELNEFINNQVKNQTDDKQSPLVLNSNPSDQLKILDPEIKKNALVLLDSKGGINDILASRGTNSNSVYREFNTDDSLVVKFNKAIQEGKFFESQNSAFESLQEAMQNKKMKPQVLKKMRFALINSVFTKSTFLINDYINEEKLPRGDQLRSYSSNLSRCLKLLEENNFNYQKIIISSKFLEAYSYIRDKNYNEYSKAKLLLKEALELEPKAAYIHNAIGLVLNYEEKYEESSKYYAKAIELVPSWSYPVNNLALNYLAKNQYNEANELLQKAIELSRDDKTVLNNFGVLYESLGLYNDAEKYYHKVQEVNGSYSSIALRNLGHLYKARGDNETAMQYFKRAIAADSSDIYSYSALSELLIKDDLFDDAKELILKAIELEPQFSEGYSAYAYYLRSLPGSTEPENNLKFQKADSLYQLSIEKNPLNVWGYEGRAQLWKYKNFEYGEEILKQAISVNPTKAQAYLNYAGYLLQDTREEYEHQSWIKAEEYLNNAIAINANFLPAYYSLISLYNHLYPKGDEAFSLINDLLKNNYNSPDLWKLLGDTYLKKDNYLKAHDSYKKALEIDSSFAKVYTNYAYSKIRIGQYEEGEQFFKLAIKADPVFKQNYSVSFELLPLAESFYYSGEMDQSETVFEIIKRLDENSLANIGLATVQYLNGKTNQAYANTIQSLSMGFETIGSKNSDLEWKAKELLLKISIDNKDEVLAKHIYQELSNSEYFPYGVEITNEILFFYLVDKHKKAHSLISDLHPVMLKDEYLEKHFSQNSINVLRNFYSEKFQE